MNRRRNSEVPVLRPEDLSVEEVLCFVAGWQPPQTDRERARWRWRTWREFLDEWAHLRPAWAASDWLPPVTPHLFVERVAAVARDLTPLELQALRYHDVPTDGDDFDPAA
jgi:hypothetical protein